MGSSSIWDYFLKKLKLNFFFGFNYSKRAGFKAHPKFINRKEFFFIRLEMIIRNLLKTKKENGENSNLKKEKKKKWIMTKLLWAFG
jgi:hypothetical protein